MTSCHTRRFTEISMSPVVSPSSLPPQRLISFRLRALGRLRFFQSPAVMVARISLLRASRNRVLKPAGMSAAATGLIDGVTDSNALRWVAEPAKPLSQSVSPGRDAPAVLVA